MAKHFIDDLKKSKIRIHKLGKTNLAKVARFGLLKGKGIHVPKARAVVTHSS